MSPFRIKRKKNDDGFIKTLIPCRKVRLASEKFEYLIYVF